MTDEDRDDHKDHRDHRGVISTRTPEDPDGAHGADGAMAPDVDDAEDPGEAEQATGAELAGDGAGAEAPEEGTGEEAPTPEALDGADEEPRRRFLTWRRGIAVVVILAALAGLAAVGAEHHARREVTSQVLGSVHGFSSDARLSFNGLVLPQVMRGELDELSITASTFTIQRGGAAAPQTTAPAPQPTPEPTPEEKGLFSGLVDLITGAQECTTPAAGDPAAIQSAQLSNPVLTVEGLSTSGAHRASHVALSGTLSWAELDRMTGLVVLGVSSPSSSALQPATADSPGTALLSGTVCGQSVGVNLEPAVTEAGGASLTITSVSWAGREIPADQSFGGKTALEWLGMSTSSIELPVDALPAGYRVTSAQVGAGGIDLTIEASDIDLSAPAPASSSSPS